MSIFLKSPFRHALGDGPLPHSRTLRTTLHKKMQDTLNVFWDEEYGLVKKPIDLIAFCISIFIVIPTYSSRKLHHLLDSLASATLKLTNQAAERSKLLLPVTALFYLIHTASSFLSAIFHEISSLYSPIKTLLYSIADASNKLISRSVGIVVMPAVVLSHIIASAFAWQAERKANALIVTPITQKNTKNTTTMTLGALLDQTNPRLTLSEINVVLRPNTDTLLIQGRNQHDNSRYYRETYAQVDVDEQSHPGLFALAKLNPNVAITLNNESMLFSPSGG